MHVSMEMFPFSAYPLHHNGKGSIATTNLLYHVSVGLKRKLGLEGQGKLVKQVSRRFALVALPLQEEDTDNMSDRQTDRQTD